MSVRCARVRRFGLPLLALMLSGLAACSTFTSSPKPAPPVVEAPDRVQAVSFEALPGWRTDAVGGVLPAWQTSCRRLEARGDDDRMSARAPLYGRVADWRRACTAMNTLDPGDHDRMRRFLESHFVPVAISGSGGFEGKFTGYFEPELQGARRRGGPYQTPLHGVPSDLVQVDLGAFRDSLAGERLAGRVISGRLTPFESRGEIARKGAGSTAPVLVWVDDPVDAFFLHIQGSGRVRLDDGRTMRVGYAGHNGHPYTAIGRVLIDRGELSKENVSMQSIRAWLKANPDRAGEVMDANAAYIFFRELTNVRSGDGPLGAEGVPLTPGRSLAVDPRFHSYGVPLWVASMLPDAQASAPDRPFTRLMMAQDTGGAIRGAVRGDIYVGTGSTAGAIAGRTNHPGTIHALLPRPLADRLGLTDGRPRLLEQVGAP